MNILKYKKIFIYCINCNKIFCNNCKCNFEHNNYININDINTKCSFHKDNDLCGYCLNDKTHLCNKCLKNGQHTNHNIAKLSEFEIGNEEIVKFENTINYLKNKLKELNEKMREKLKELYEKKKLDLNLKYKQEKEKIISKKNERINEYNKRFIEKEKQIKINLYEKLREKGNNIFKEFTSLLSLLDSQLIDSNYNNINDNFKLFDDFFNIIEEKINKYKNIIKEIKINYDKSIIEMNNCKNNEINKIKNEFQNNIYFCEEKNDSE